MEGRGIVRVRRGDIVESEHAFAWCLADAEVGPPVFMRSAAKPFQALAALRAGVLERFGLDPRHLALGCASHGGSDEHVARVREILAAVGRDESDLACGPGEPRDPEAASAFHAAGGRPEPVRHNCSGKHALGIALAVANDWPVKGYAEAGHPLQQAMLAGVAEATELEPDVIPNATDGCGMRTFSVGLDRVAGAFGRLAGGGLGEAGTRLAAAMSAHPELVAYSGAIDTELMRSEPGLVSKVGAEGVLGIGLPDGRGAALKVLDGAFRALEPAAVLVAREGLGLAVGSPAVDGFAAAPVLNSHGDHVGHVEAELL
jgi:L-asparaginase II